MSGPRILPLTVEDAFTNMAVDEAVFTCFEEGKSPVTLRFFRWDPSAISIGRFQGLEFEVDTEATSKHGVDVIRRITGGGSVFHDSTGELTYSFVAGEDLLPGDVEGTFRKICEALVEGFGNLGVDAEYREVNDVVAGGKKISGSAQTRRGENVLQHGTILIDPDIKRMFQLLKVPKEKITDKFISSAYQRVTSLKRELDYVPDYESIMKEMIEGFEKKFDVDFEKGDLNSCERNKLDDLRGKYGSIDWIEKR